jgi:hypothetical protein
MRKRESDGYRVDEEARGRVGVRVRELCEKGGSGVLRDLFVGELGYDYGDVRLDLADDKSRGLVYGDECLRTVATGGDGEFKVIYVRLRASLSRACERTLIAKLLAENGRALFVFSDAEQRQWHFVNVKYKEGMGDAKNRLLRRITIGRDEQLRTAIERIALLDLGVRGGDGATLSASTIQGLVDRAFDVEALARAFFREYRVTFALLQKELCEQTGDEIWAHDYALQLLNRCMLLYFIQWKRGLVQNAQSEVDLKILWDRYNGSEHEADIFVSVWLNRLFFKDVHKQDGIKGEHDISYSHNGRVDVGWWKGGLFAENELDRRGDFVVSDRRLGDIVSLLEGYTFSMAENSPLDQEVAVDPEMMGTVYESLVNVSGEIDERSEAGIFYTPRTEIDLMCRLTLVDYLSNHLGKEYKHLLYTVVFAIEQEDKERADQKLKEEDLCREVYELLNRVRMIDPACGSGAFLMGMLVVLDDLMGRAVRGCSVEISYSHDSGYERKKRIIGQSLYGVDVMEWAVHIAELRLWLALMVDAEDSAEGFYGGGEPLLSGFTSKVRCGDSLVEESSERCFDIVLGNPPYLRQENIHTPYLKDQSKEDSKAYKKKLAHAMYERFPNFFGYRDGKQTITNPINQKSDLYIYFYLLGLSLLNSKGTLCFITSNSWLDVGYGAGLQEFLVKHCHIKLILDNETRRSFAEARVNTVIAHISSPNEESEWGLQETARFVMSRVPFEYLLVAGIFEDIEGAEYRQTCGSYRVFPIKQEALLEQEKLTVGNKWGGKYLRAPDIYWTIIEKGKGRLVRLGDIAEVRRGVTTGVNEFFYVDEESAREWKIEPEFLVPIIKSPRECKRMLIDEQTLKVKLFLCRQSKEELKGSRALDYINWGESKGFQKRASCVGKTKWWSLALNTANSVFVKEANETSAVFYNPECYPVDCRLYYANLSPIVMVYLNSVVGALSCEIYNRAGLGAGARSLMVADYEQIPVLAKEVKRVELGLLQGMYALAPRKLTNVQEQGWLEIDAIIFDELGLTGGEREAVYEAVGELMHVRLNKAKSLGIARVRKWGGRDVI